MLFDQESKGNTADTTSIDFVLLLFCGGVEYENYPTLILLN